MKSSNLHSNKYRSVGTLEMKNLILMFQLMSNTMNQMMNDCQINFIQNSQGITKYKKFAHAHVRSKGIGFKTDFPN